VARVTIAGLACCSICFFIVLLGRLAAGLIVALYYLPAVFGAVAAGKYMLQGLLFSA
jgi:hypothetical protein